jgi:hypothetical protein
MLVVFVRGWPRGGATLKHINLQKNNMEIDDKNLVKHKLNYLKLAFKISRIRYHGDEPPKGLLQRAYEFGRLAGISEKELKNL